MVSPHTRPVIRKTFTCCDVSIVECLILKNFGANNREKLRVYPIVWNRSMIFLSIQDWPASLMVCNVPCWYEAHQLPKLHLWTRKEGSWLWRHNERDSVSNHQRLYCLLKRLFRRRSKVTSKLRVTGLCAWNSPGTGEFPAQKASNAENVSIWWRHHVMRASWHEGSFGVSG